VARCPRTSPKALPWAFSGQRSDATGLYFYNARYYSPLSGRFISADTIVPEPGNPQALNRYAYVFNNPLKYVDPSGHCPQSDRACWDLLEQLSLTYGWNIDTRFAWSLKQLQTLWAAAQDIQAWFERNGGNGLERMNGTIGPVFFTRSQLVSSLDLSSANPLNYVLGTTVYLAPEASRFVVIHEIGHVIDNVSGSDAVANLLGGAAIWGGGASDAMAKDLGGEPHTCQIRAYCWGHKTPREGVPRGYEETGPSEDFAQTFALSVTDPQGLRKSAPARAQWMEKFATLQVNQVPYAGYWDLFYRGSKVNLTGR
jgi:RHS repeat-associated protein